MAEDVLVAHYATRGGRYEIKAYQRRNSHGVYYSVESYTKGRADGACTGLSVQELGIELARKIFFAKRCDGINYQPVVEWPAASRILSGAPVQETAAQ